MEPMLPWEAERSLDDLTDRLNEQARPLSRLKGVTALRPAMRIVNAFHSNMIEGHVVSPHDIERALSRSKNLKDCEAWAVSHINLQTSIDASDALAPWPVNADFIRQLHLEFCNKLPASLLKVSTPDKAMLLSIAPGAFRSVDVAVGRHVAPPHEAVPSFVQRAEEAYRPSRLDRRRQLIALAASHHRILWIHPFADFNGRVVRLMSHALCRTLGLIPDLWSISRGLARSGAAYRAHLSIADAPRQGDLDGRGALSQKGLVQFCRYFLECCSMELAYVADHWSVARALEAMQPQVERHSFLGLRKTAVLELLARAFEDGRDVSQAALRAFPSAEERDTTLQALTDLGFFAVSESHVQGLVPSLPVSIVTDVLPELFATQALQ
jgi:Fic family protein